MNRVPAWLNVDVTLTQTDRLSPADRCDRCGAQAYIRAVMQSGDLLFCAHHGRDQMEALKRVALEIDDQSDQLDLVLEQLDQSK